MKRISLILMIVGLSCMGNRSAFAQSFVNLNFESANVTGYSPGIIPASNAFPGWSVTAPNIFYNDISLSGGSISIYETNSPTSPTTESLPSQFCFSMVWKLLAKCSL